MPIASAAQGIAGIRLGTTPITRVYSGTSLVYDATPAAPVLLGMTPTSKTTAQMDASVQTLWTNWKTNLRQDTTKGWYAVFANAQAGANPYVAEGQGYGMLLAAQMSPYDANAKTIFDGLTKYVIDHPSSIDTRLHAAEQDANMVSHNGADSATDGDLDIAMALLMADKRWGSAGTHNYLALAKTRITAIKETLVSPTTGLLELGDWSSGTWNNISRPSDWMIGHFEAFRAATGDTAWDTILAAHITAIKRLQATYAPATGLLPDFTVNPPATVAPAPADTLEGANDGNYYYNACRVPWRLGVASNTDSRTAAAKISAWAKTKSGGVPANMPTGYLLNGTTVTGGNYPDMSFIAPFAVAASTGNDQGWLNSLWDYLAANSNNTDYYSGSIQLLCMIYLSRTYRVDPATTGTAPVSVPASVRSVSSASILYSTAAKTIDAPPGVATGDMLLLIMHCDYGAAADFKVPTGFTTLNTRELAANGDKQVIGYKIATGFEPASYTLGVPVDADMRADLLCIQGVDSTVSPTINTAVSASSATTHTAPTVTPGSARGLLITAASLSAGTAGQTFSWTPPSGMVERTDAATNGYVTQTTATQTWDSTAATGTKAFSLTMSATAKQALTASIVVASGTSGGGSTPPPASGYTPKSSLTAGASATGPYTFRRAVSYTNGTRTSPYHIDATAASATTPAPLIIHLHGDGFEEYTNMAAGTTSSVAYRYMDVAKSHGAIGVIPRTPDTSSETWYTAAYATTWLVALINELKSTYNVDTNRIYYSGFSGGAEQITYNMMCDHHTLTTGGGAMILGGGGADGVSFTGTPAASLKADFPMRWVVGENDVAGATFPADWSARDTAVGGEAFYRNAGFETSITIIPGKAHNDSEPYGPWYLNELINESNIDKGMASKTAPAGAAVPPVTTAPTPPTTPTGYTAAGSNGSTGSWTDAITTNRTLVVGANTSEYRFWGSHVPTADRTKPIPLVIHFHGDGAWEYDNPTTWTSPLYMQVAKDLGGIGVIPNAVNKTSRAWWSGTAGANWARGLILDLMGKYNIDKRQVYLSGYSGGAVLITEDIMVKWHADFLGGGAMLLGGGQPGTLVGTPSTALKTDFPMRWHVGANDIAANAPDGYDGLAAAKQGETFYKGLGFNTGITILPNQDHDESEDKGPAALRALVNISRTRYGLPTI